MQTEASTIRFKSTEGDWVAKLYPARAPLTVKYFTNLINTGALNNTSIYRIVTQNNQPSNVTQRIEVIQGGGMIPTDGESFDFLTHESTSLTGIKHKKYTLSMPRFNVTQVYKSFFITMGEFPCLDYKGKRHEDGQGFAAFGEITSGFETLDRIFSRAGISDILNNPITLESVVLEL